MIRLMTLLRVGNFTKDFIAKKQQELETLTKEVQGFEQRKSELAVRAARSADTWLYGSLLFLGAQGFAVARVNQITTPPLFLLHNSFRSVDLVGIVLGYHGTCTHISHLLVLGGEGGRSRERELQS